MKIATSLLVLICTVVIFSAAVCADVNSATHTIGQKKYQYNHGSAKGAEKPAYVITAKPFADKVVPQESAPQRPNKAEFTGSDQIRFLQNGFSVGASETAVIHFDLNSSELPRVEEQKLYRLAIIVNKEKEVAVTGYTCPKGSLTVNERLAWDRAKNIAAWLENHDMRVRTISGKPKCCYVSKTNLAENRRAEIEFTPKPN